MTALTIGNDRMAAIAVSGIKAATKMMDSPTTRLTTGKRINQASDDVGRLAMLSNLSAEILSVKAAAANAVETMSMLDKANSAQIRQDFIPNQRNRHSSVECFATSVDRTALINEKGLLTQEIAKITNTTK